MVSSTATQLFDLSTCSVLSNVLGHRDKPLDNLSLLWLLIVLQVERLEEERLDLRHQLLVTARTRAQR